MKDVTMTDLIVTWAVVTVIGLTILWVRHQGIILSLTK